MSSQLTERGSLDVESEMLPQEPPPWIIRSTAWLLLAAFLFALLVAIVMRLPETVHCQFVLIPATGADPIQSPRQAIISHVAVEEGQPVKLGGESEIDLVKLKLDLAGSEKDLSVAQRTVQQVNLDRERMETVHARQRAEQQ